MEWKAGNKESINVGIIGLGYVGLPMAIQFARANCIVTGFDTDEKKVDSINIGQSYIKNIVSEHVQEQVQSKRLRATGDFAKIAEQDAVLICVPTPLSTHREPDLSYVTSTGRAIAPYLQRGQLVSLESTTYPGTTEEELLPILENGSGLKAGIDFHLVFSPEREDPGNPNFSTRDIPKIIGGITENCCKAAVDLYSRAVKSVVPVSNTKVAEATKLVENIFRGVNIAMVNELKIVFERMNIDIWEVLDAAKTKPFGFMKFEPGPGLGGHCLIGAETVRIRDEKINTVIQLSDLFKTYSQKVAVHKVGDAEVMRPRNLETLSIDPQTKETSWKKVSMLFRRPYKGNFVEIRVAGNRTICTTDRHPMLVVEDEQLIVKEAHNLKINDRLPQFSGITNPVLSANKNPYIDILALLPEEVIDKLYVRVRDTHWGHYESILKSHFGWIARDFIRQNSLSAKRYLEIEAESGLSRDQLLLLYGRGKSHSHIPAVISITPDVCRFLGYFLSEGCISIERGNPRVRLTFNRSEIEYINDVCLILNSLGIPTSLYQDKNWYSTTVRVGSSLIGYLLNNILSTGKNSKEMRIPEVVMGASAQHHEQILAGLLRGDGDVDIQIKSRKYIKNGREYNHAFNTGTIGFFSSSPELFAQVEHLLHSLGFSPMRKRRTPYLRIAGSENLKRLSKLFDGAKYRKIAQIEEARLRINSTKKTKKWFGGITVPVEEVSVKNSSDVVYSIEVPESNTFVTTGGIFVHNCIPIDPFYLTWKAHEYGVQTKFIELAGEINTSMPRYVITRLMEALSDNGKPLKDAQILLMGLAYKKNVDDPRESPSFVLWDLLRERGAKVCYHDPYVPIAPYMRQHPDYVGEKSVDLTSYKLSSVDAVLIATAHDCINYTEVVRNAQLVIDTRNACINVPSEIKGNKIVKA